MRLVVRDHLAQLVQNKPQYNKVNYRTVGAGDTEGKEYV